MIWSFLRGNILRIVIELIVAVVPETVTDSRERIWGRKLTTLVRSLVVVVDATSN